VLCRNCTRTHVKFWLPRTQRFRRLEWRCCCRLPPCSPSLVVSLRSSKYVRNFQIDKFRAEVGLKITFVEGRTGSMGLLPNFCNVWRWALSSSNAAGKVHIVDLQGLILSSVPLCGSSDTVCCVRNSFYFVGKQIWLSPCPLEVFSTSQLSNAKYGRNLSQFTTAALPTA